MSSQPLAGRRIVVTRPRELAEGLAAGIRAAGGEPILLPAIEIRDLDDVQAFGAVARRLEQFDWAIFVSPMAVRKALALLQRFRDGAAWPSALRVAAIGRGTQRALQEWAIGAALAPSGSADSEALLALAEFERVAGLRIVIFRGVGGRELLGETLGQRGALVEYAECYVRAAPAPGSASRAVAEAGTIDAFTVSSAEGLQNLVALLGEAGRRRLIDALLVVPHARVAARATQHGAQRVTVAGPGDAEMLAALVAYFGSGRR